MPKFKVNKPFIDVHSKEEYAEGQEIEMTIERSIEAATNLAKYGGGFFVAVEEQQPSDDKPLDKLTKDEIKEKLDELQVAYDADANKPELLDALKAKLDELGGE